MPCTTILVGKKASNDGSTIIARNDDGSFEAKRLAVINPKDQPKKYKTVISHLEIELPENPMRYTAAPNVNKSNGVWPANGINEKNVAMTATETITNNSRVLGADPLIVYKKASKKGEKDTPGGIGEEDLVTIVLPYIKSAREGVLRTGELLEKYGTYESNGMAFSDSNEIWWLETIGGHHWIAKKVPDDAVVIMPNCFGLDKFDFEDAFGEKNENLCSRDLPDFINKFHLNLGETDKFNPRLAFGTFTDADHIYNTPRSWFMANYLCPNSFDYNPESNNIPWSVKPSKLITVEDVKYLLSSRYQGTKYNPYGKDSDAGKYRVIGVPNSDVSGIMQIRGYMPVELQAVQWYSMGGSGFTCCFPLYTNVSKLPDYFSKTTETVSTDAMYWHSRIIAALTDAHFPSAIIHDERYCDAVFTRSMELLNKSDAELSENYSEEKAAAANDKVAKMVREESDKALSAILRNASEHMKTRYHRGDN